MNAFLVAWRASRYLPVPVIRAIAGAFAWLAWLMKAKPVARLEDNLHRVTGVQGRPLRSLSRRGMSSTARYYAETLELPRLSGEAIDARVRMVNHEDVLASIANHGAVVVALSHSGNWDIVGAFACRNVAQVTAVAEVLKPQEVFDEFVKAREDAGMIIFGHEGSSTFRRLITQTKDVGGVLALVADRDISGSGTPVTMWGHDVKVAPGPAALAAATRKQLVPLHVHYERLYGAQRRRAKSRWGIVMDFGPMIDPADAPKEDRIGHLSREWAAAMAEGIARRPEDWHMLQRFGWSA